MCHSPSGAFPVHAPERACWASADITTAADKPAASPPDTTFCAKRFITNLREKGDSPALRQLMRCCGTDFERKRLVGGPRSAAGSVGGINNPAREFIATCGQQQYGPGCAQPTTTRGDLSLDE